ncbi:ATP-binding protein [Streptomyces sp. SHP 1-2]|uniref:ATP-binding protein n=1 Tax=Streptomyces sp. SHP 1-2 TaxID=2769489 RepID=UPI0022389919|nr:ATP-binding protein [Streptomyces sp. SHP 1-2]MCW5251757.1 sensor histidine kinase [Streptomyces sp. SHP 1-2]
MIEIPELAAAGLAAGTLTAFALGGGLLSARRGRARQNAEIEAVRERLDAAQTQLVRAQAAFSAELDHLAAHRMPAEASRLAHPHVPVPGPLGPAGAGTEPVLAELRRAVLQERKRVDAAARSGMRGTTREIQAGLYRLQDVLHGLQLRYDDPELAQTLYALDHENEQSLRRAQVAAVICGAWVGLAREESHLVDAVTGGQARLVGYHRVRVQNHLEPGTALVSHAVEPVAIIMAELLDNALRHSSPETAVVVNLERAHHGVTVTVDDAGVGMAPDERRTAQGLVAGTEPIMLSDLGDPPRMGLAAIGQLTRQFDLSVDLSTPSPYGGVRAILLIKTHLLSYIDPLLHPPSASAAPSTRQYRTEEHEGPEGHPDAFADRRPTREEAARGAALETPLPQPPAPADPPPPPAPAAAPDAGPGATPRPAPGGYPDGDLLPQRRRRARTAAAADRAAPPRSPVRTPEESAAALGALQSATNAAREAAATEGSDPL